MRDETFDLIVIGSGAAAATVAARCRSEGWTVAVVDKRPFGGTCANRGCDPKKVLVGAAAAVEAARHLDGKGVRAGAALDWPELMAFKRTFTDPVPQQREAGLREQGIEPVAGVARFASRSTMTIGDRTIEARRAIVIAAGARPADLPITGAEHLITSDDFLDLPALPGSVVFVGGGFISFEFAHVAARAGARVTIIHQADRPLEAFDPWLVSVLVTHTRNLGIDVILGATVTSVERAGDGFRVTSTQDGEARTVDADLVVHGAGRVPDLGDLACEAGGVARERRGVVVDGYLQSVSNPLVWAAGDCAATGAPALTPVASYEGRIVAANLLEPERQTADYRVVPSCVFTLPPLSSVGLTEARAAGAGFRFVTKQGDRSSWYSVRRLGASTAAYKVLIEEGTGQVLGAHLLGPHADEVINVFAAAMRAGMPASQLRQALWAYPTSGSDVPYML